MFKFIVSFISLLNGLSFAQESRIIGGQEVNQETNPAIVKVHTLDGTMCSGTVVGKYTVLTAAHCETNNSFVAVTMGKKQYGGTLYRSDLYPNVDHDLAIIVMDNALPLHPLSLGRRSAEGQPIRMLGYGCTNANASSLDEKLREGDATIRGINTLDFITEGDALCFGDTGGPALNQEGKVIGIGSKGNLTNRSYFTRLDNDQTLSFMKVMAETYELEICGFNKTCK